MCCRIQSFQFERFCSQETAVEAEDEEEDFPATGSLNFKNFINFNSLPEQKYGIRKSEKSELFNVYILSLIVCLFP